MSLSEDTLRYIRNKGPKLAKTVCMVTQANQLFPNVIGRHRRYGWYWKLGLTLLITFYVVRTFLN